MPKTIKRTDHGYECDGIHVSELTPRESQALLLRAHGYSYRECADMMNCSANAVQARISNLFYKLNATSTPELIMKAFRAGYLRFLSIAVAMLVGMLPAKLLDNQNQLARVQRVRARHEFLLDELKLG